MKSITPKYLLLLFIVVGFVSAQNVELKLYDNIVTANEFFKAKDGSVGFILMKPAIMKKNETPFGFWLPTDAKTPFLIVTEGENGKPALSVTGKDFSSKAKIQKSGNKSTAVYTSGSGAKAIEIFIQSDVHSNSLMPLAKDIQCVIRVTTKAVKNPHLTVNLRGDGAVALVGTKGVTVSKTVQNNAVGPNLLLTAAGETQVAPASSSQQKSGGTATFTGGSEIQFSIAGSTVSDSQKSLAQVTNIENTISTKTEKTEMAIFNEADKSNPLPGDTVTFTIFYHNIGTAPAKDISISNPIPEKMKYIENSAAGNNTEISITHKDVPPPQQGDVESINWVIKRNILPGEQGSVSFKTIIQ